MSNIQETDMNNERRKALGAVVASVQEALSKLDGLSGDLETARDEEQESFDNLPEGLQQAERGQSMEAAVSAMDQALGALEEAVGNLDEVVSSLEEAMQ
jgi:ABC-type transporter Mla subunit MlaD